MVDHRAGARPPDRVGVALEVLGGLVAHQFEGVAPFEKGLDLCRQAFEFDRLDLRAILFALEAPLGDLVVVEFAFDPVGGALTETAFRSLAWKGRHLVVGFAAGSIPALPVNLALLKGSSLVGVDLARFSRMHEPAVAADNIRQLLAWFAEGKLRLEPGRIVPLAEAPAALKAVLERQAVGKIVVEI